MYTYTQIGTHIPNRVTLLHPRRSRHVSAAVLMCSHILSRSQFPSLSRLPSQPFFTSYPGSRLYVHHVFHKFFIVCVYSHTHIHTWTHLGRYIHIHTHKYAYIYTLENIFAYFLCMYSKKKSTYIFM